MRRVLDRLFDLTGFQGKTLWDLMGLLIVPLFIAGATLALSISELRREDQRAQDSVLQSYIQDMTNLLLNRGLATSKPDSLVTQVARAHTVSAIRRLDSGRRGILLGFLSDSNLLGSNSSVALLSYADLSGADLRGANLSVLDLSGADLSDANLRDTVLAGANLSNASLDDAFLSDAFLVEADLRDTVLAGANLSNASLDGANLARANLFHANLNGAILNGADLSGAKDWSNEQLAQAESLVGATMPAGTVMTEKAWEEFKKQYRK